ncbi:MAG: hypothetical protein M1814_003888 [Vezdaea aestivalis]|nr:MAG: hypothetical protein M1814_003888 [Vezdaea aestivalis]
MDLDFVLGKITQQAVNYAIRSGITITSGFAIRQCGRLLKTVDKDDRDELISLKQRLEGKIRIISPAIDMIELISARGNTSLESAVVLTKELRWEIQSLGVRLAQAASSHERSKNRSSIVQGESEVEFKFIVQDIKRLLKRIEDAVPLINLAITTSGARLSSSLPTTVSPSRLLQASTFLTAGDAQYCMHPGEGVQVGPAFTLSLYMLFSGHSIREQAADGSLRGTTWKEVMHKARVKLCRVPLDQLPPSGDQISSDNPSAADYHENLGRADEYAYQIVLIEDLDDDRAHALEEGELPPSSFEDVRKAGIREILPVHEISKIFYADTGKILNIGNDSETNSPILLLKRDPNAIPPRRMMKQKYRDSFGLDDAEEDQQVDSVKLEGVEETIVATQSDIDSQLMIEQCLHSPTLDQPTNSKSNGLPPGLDPEWLALEVFIQEPDSDSESEDLESELTDSLLPISSRAQTAPPTLTSGMARLGISWGTPSTPSQHPSSEPGSVQKESSSETLGTPVNQPALASGGNVRSSLSLLETLIRLTSLQQFQQSSHLTITDELLNFFLSESSTTGAGPDGDARRRTRAEARQKVGFDPYDESPIKHRGEEYLSRPGGGVEYSDEPEWRNSSPMRWDHGTPSTSNSPTPATGNRMGGAHRKSTFGSQSSPLSQNKATSRTTFITRDPELTNKSSPLRKVAAQTDSTLGSSPSNDDIIPTTEK